MVQLRNLVLVLAGMLCICCGESVPDTKKVAAKELRKSDFVFREKMIRGNDTGMIQLRGSVEAVLAQHWFLDNTNDVSDDRLVWENGDGERLFPSLNLFPDSTVLENPRSGVRIGRWRRELDNKVNTIIVDYGNKQQRRYRIRELSLSNLRISWREGADSFWVKFRSDGMAHQNILNDPYHPSNNKWRIKPVRKESLAEINERVKACVKFYALYYRDHIKRRKKAIEFVGLPEIFTWYNGAIGLPMKGGMDESWVDCFYNRQQAETGYDILNDLIVKHEFDWPTNTPGWHYRTHSVLEQMHEKLANP